MRNDKEVQDELDAAQADLEAKIGALKDVLEEKLETPKHVIEAVERPISWIAHHAVLAACIAVGVGYLVHRLRAPRAA